MLIGAAGAALAALAMVWEAFLVLCAGTFRSALLPRRQQFRFAAADVATRLFGRAHFAGPCWRHRPRG
jgi:hypothetical protein